MIAGHGVFVVPQRLPHWRLAKLLTGFDRRRNSLWVSGIAASGFGVAPDSLIYAMKVFPQQ